MKFFRKVALCAVAPSLLFAQSAQACWSNAEQDAARIANLNQMLMVTALRCRFGQDNFLADYNRFVQSNNALLGSQNQVIKGHFARTAGAKGAEMALDRFSIGLANHHGGGQGAVDCSELKSLAKTVAAKRHEATSLAQLAEDVAGTPRLPGGACGVNIASRN